MLQQNAWLTALHACLGTTAGLQSIFLRVGTPATTLTFVDHHIPDRTLSGRWAGLPTSALKHHGQLQDITQLFSDATIQGGHSAFLFPGMTELPAAATQTASSLNCFSGVIHSGEHQVQ